MKMTIRGARRAFALTAAVLFLGATGAAAASAAPSPAAARPFAGQASAAGLTAPQAATLQAQVDAIIAQDGGTQVAANEIALPHGASVLLVLPGQVYARVLPGAVNLGFAAATTNNAAKPQTSGSCPYLYLCAWQEHSYMGTQFNVSTCNAIQELPGSGWSGTGSWINNESADTEGLFLDKNKNVIDEASAPFSEPEFNWGPVWYLEACIFD